MNTLGYLKIPLDQGLEIDYAIANIEHMLDTGFVPLVTTVAFDTPPIYEGKNDTTFYEGWPILAQRNHSKP